MRIVVTVLYFTDRWEAVGRNLFIVYSTGRTIGPNWAGAVKAWTEGHKYYNYGDPIRNDTGLYTQVRSVA